MGENEYGESGHLSIFTLLKPLMMLLKYNFFSGLHFYILTKDTDSMLGPCSSDFFKVKTLLNNAFNGSITRYFASSPHLREISYAGGLDPQCLPVKKFGNKIYPRFVLSFLKANV